MIRRPLNERFAAAVLEGRKVTTIRDNPWPVGKPIMLFRWSGAAYRSKQVEIAPVVVEETTDIEITNTGFGCVFSVTYVSNRPLFGTEGFRDSIELHNWFAAVVPQGQTVTKFLMRFRLATPEEVNPNPVKA